LYKDTSGKHDVKFRNEGNACKINFIKDLMIEKVVRQICTDEKTVNIVTEEIAKLNDGLSDIKYRHEIINDFEKFPNLTGSLMDAVNYFRELEEERQLQYKMSLNAGSIGVLGNSTLHRDKTPLFELKHNVETLLKILKGIMMFENALSEYDVQSEGLKKLKEYVKSCTSDESLKKLGDMLVPMLTLGVSDTSYRFAVKVDKNFKMTDIAIIDLGVDAITENNIKKKALYEKFLKRKDGRKERIQVPLTNKTSQRQIQEIIEKTVRHLSSYLRNVSNKIISPFNSLYKELQFYSFASKMKSMLEELKLPVCLPSMYQADKRIMEVHGLYDLALATHFAELGIQPLDKKIVLNDVEINPQNGILVVTGPNQSGKTVFIRAVGIIQAFAQAGLPIPAISANISLVDNIFSHFPAEEKKETQEGALGNELSECSDIIEYATDKSLVLVNEPFISTGAREASIIAGDMLKALAIIGSRAVLVTHIYELASKLNILNEETKNNCPMVSIVACTENNDTANDTKTMSGRRTYKMVKGEPCKYALAQDITKQYGISYEQLMRRINYKNNSI